MENKYTDAEQFHREATGTGKQPDKCAECPDYMISSENCPECHKEEVLKPCPFCGEKEMLYSLTDFNTKKGHAGCRCCFTATIADSEELAVRKWNTRTGETNHE